MGHTNIDDESDLRARILAAYHRLARRPGGWVRITDLRTALSDVARADLDAALVTVAREPGVSLIAQENRRRLTAADRADAVRVGAQYCHLLAVEEA